MVGDEQSLYPKSREEGFRLKGDLGWVAGKMRMSGDWILHIPNRLMQHVITTVTS